MASRSAPLVLVGLAGVGALIAAALWLLSEGDGGRAGPDALRPQAAPVEAAPSVPAPLAPRPTPSAAQPSRLDAREPPAATDAGARAPLAATLVRLADGAPLAGWSVRPPPDVGAAPPSVATDDEGRFAFESVPRALTHVAITRAGLPKGRRVHVELPADAFERERTCTVDTGWVLEGRVRSAAGRALVDAGVLGDDSAFVVPEPDGAFRLEDVGPRGLVPGPYTLTAGAALHTRVERELHLDADTRVLRGLDLVLDAAGALEGRVLGADGYAHPFELVSLPLRITERTLERVEPMLTSDDLRPVSVLLGSAREPGDSVAEHDVAATDELRHYRVDSIPPGRYVVRVQPPRSRFVATEALFEFAQASQPEAGAENEASEIRRRPIIHIMDDIPPTHAAPDHWERQVDIVAGEVTRLDVRLAWGAVLELRVSDAFGTPLSGAVVEVLRELTWDFATRGTYLVPPEDGFEVRQLPTEGRSGSRAQLTISAGVARTDAEGRAALGRLPPGDVTLRVRAPLGSSLRGFEDGVRLVAGETTRLDVALDPGFTLRGRIIDEQGVPIPEARVAAKRPSDTVIILADDIVRADERGGFVIEGLDAGEWVLHLSAPGHVDATPHVQAGAPPLELVLVRARGLALRVLDAHDGAPLPECTLTVSSGNTYTQRTASTEEGRVFLDGLGAEPVSLTVSAPGYRALSRTDLTPLPGPAEQVPELLLRLERDG